MQRSKLLALIVAIAPFTVDSHAALYDRGNGMIYDSAQNITWLQDMNYFKALGYSSNGARTWYDANFFAAFLEYGGYDDWRLASTQCVSCSGGYGQTHSELGYLFYVELGNHSPVDGPSGQPYGLVNTGPFINFQSGPYWLADHDPEYLSERAWFFDTHDGYSGLTLDRSYFYAPIVRDGDVSPVPLPAAAWLLGSALLGLAGAARRKQ